MTVELDMKLVPLMVKACAAAPALPEAGDRLVMLGTGFDGGGEEVPPPPPPQDARTTHMRAIKKEIVKRRVPIDFGLADCLFFNIVGHLFL